jgi:NADH-quinone oxidoreductase subunit J
MDAVFYIAALVAISATVLMLTQLNAVHALLYLIVSLFAVAIVFYTLGAPFAAALEVIIYAGAIMVLFVFVEMLLNLGRAAIETERSWYRPRMWLGPSILATILAAELVFLMVRGLEPASAAMVITPAEVGATFFGPYMLGVELASMLLLGGMVATYHLGWQGSRKREAE